MTQGLRFTLSSPTTSAQTPATKSACAASLTVGAKIMRKSPSAVARNASAVPFTIRRMPVSISDARTVPESYAVCGITL
jgi:hypothetical protein